MADLHELPNIPDAERKASEWIARLNADDVSAEDRARFETWLHAHPLHSRLYSEFSATWGRFTAAGPLIRAVSFANSMSESRVVARSRRQWPWIAAGIMGCLSALCWLYIEQRATDKVFKTAVGEHATIALPDGSTLELNSNSIAMNDYSEHARVIRLERGEAFFKVAHDTQRPFWVVASGSWVRAVGTAFTVYVRSDSVQVTVSEGAVKVGSNEPQSDGAPSDDVLSKSPTAVLTAGQQANVHGAATATRKLSVDELARSVAWREGRLDFENQDLSDVIDELGRYTTLKVIVQDEKLRHLSVGGTFQASPQGTEALLTMLEQGFELRVRRDGEHAYIDSGSVRRADH